MTQQGQQLDWGLLKWAYVEHRQAADAAWAARDLKGYQGAARVCHEVMDTIWDTLGKSAADRIIGHWINVASGGDDDE